MLMANMLDLMWGILGRGGLPEGLVVDEAQGETAPDF